ncbi:MAG TPA: hypothetical protein VHT91_42315 [Kofleriaceae bacterium]|nr:hypothetical protein [Kofleriaceae bacterium]
MRAAHRFCAALLFGLTACPSPRSPGELALSGATVEIGRTGSLLAGVASDGATVFAALTAQLAAPQLAAPATPTSPAGDPPAANATPTSPANPQPAANAAPGTAPTRVTAPVTTIEALRPAGGAAPVWHTELPGYGGPLAIAGPQLVAVLGGTGSVAGLALRGEPGAAVAALDAATGAPAWKLAVDSTEWAVIAAIAATGDGVAIGGTFSGTLRIADRVVSSAGETDGFAARLTATGGVAWLIRVGGPGADAVHGVAAAGDKIALAGSFAPGAELLGEPLVSFDERSPRADGFVAELDPAGARRWVQSFGGKADDAVAGAAIDAAGRIAIAATAIDTVHLGGSELTAAGPADGLVAWWGPGGTLLDAVLVGGPDFDGLRAIAPAGDRVVVAGFYAGSIRLGGRALTAGGGDDAFLAELDLAGTVVQAWPVGGEGREEITALAAIPGGFVAGVAHTARALLDGAALPAPADPMSGAAILIRPVR